MRLPDFIIGGAPRAGTTWLYEVLDRHPDIRLAKPIRPEPKFFLIEDEYAKGIEYYSRTWFSHVSKDVLTGEKTTNYLENPAVAERIFRHMPLCKLIFILREPIQRAFSNYLWSRMNGLESLSFEEAFAREAEREAVYPDFLRYARPHSYFSRGRYAGLLTPFFSFFGDGNILCLKFDRIIASPDKIAESIHAFLGVVPRPADGLDVGKINASEGAGTEGIPENVLRAMQASYLPYNRELVELLGNEYADWCIG